MKKLTRCFSTIALLLLPVVFVCGCGLSANQRAGVETFSAATRDLAALTDAEVVRIRSDVIEMNELRRKLGDKDAKTLDGGLTVDNVRIHVDAVDALASYAELLQTLLETSQKDELKKAANSFVSSLRKANAVELTDKNAEILGQAIQLVGGMIVERMRAKAVRNAVNIAHPHVQAIIGTLSKAITPGLGSLGTAHKTAAGGLASQVGMLTARGAEDISVRILIAEATNLRERKTARFAMVSAAIRESCTKLGEADNELVSLMAKSDLTTKDIEGYVKQVRQLITTYKILAND